MVVQLMKKPLAAYAAAGAALMGTAGVADADFTGYYDHVNWVFLTGSDAFVSIANATTLEIVGADDGIADVATYTIAAQANGVVSFHYSYFSNDSGNWDNAGFYLNGSLIQLINNDTQGSSFTFSTNVNAGDIFGFFVRSEDGFIGPGVLTVNNFSGPTTAVPEPGTTALLALGTVGGALVWRKRGKMSSGKKKVAKKVAAKS